MGLLALVKVDEVTRWVFVQPVLKPVPATGPAITVPPPPGTPFHSASQGAGGWERVSSGLISVKGERGWCPSAAYSEIVCNMEIECVVSVEAKAIVRRINDAGIAAVEPISDCRYKSIGTIELWCTCAGRRCRTGAFGIGGGQERRIRSISV